MCGFSFKRIWLWQAVALVLLNLTIKGLFLSSPILGMDEPFTLFRIQQSYTELINALASNNHPPLFESIMWIWHRLVGYDASSLRVVPLLFSSAAAGVLYLMARSHFNGFTAWLSALTYSLSNPYFYFSHEIRAYSLLSLLTFLSIWTFLNLQKKPTKRRAIVLAFFNVLLLYTHYFGIFIVAAQVASVLPNFKKKLALQLAVSLGITFLLYIPQILMVYSRWVAKVGKGHWLEEPGIDALYNMLSKFFNIPLGAALALLLLSVSVYKIIQKKRRDLSVFLFLFPATYLAMWLVSQHLAIFHDRYVSIAMNGIFVLIAFGISELDKKWKVPIALVFLAVMATQVHLQPSHGQQTAQLSNDLKALRAKQEIPTYIYPAWSYQCFSYHYDLESFKKYQRTQDLLKSEKIIFTNEKDAIKKAKLQPKAILINFEGEIKLNSSLKGDYRNYGKQSLLYIKN